MEEFNRDIYDYIIASDENVFDAVATASSILVIYTYNYNTMLVYFQLPRVPKTFLACSHMRKLSRLTFFFEGNVRKMMLVDWLLADSCFTKACKRNH